MDSLLVGVEGSVSYHHTSGVTEPVHFKQVVAVCWLLACSILLLTWMSERSFLRIGQSAAFKIVQINIRAKVVFLPQF